MIDDQSFNYSISSYPKNEKKEEKENKLNHRIPLV